MADHLSKANFGAVRELSDYAGWALHLEPCVIPAALLAWLERPVPDDDLGNRLLQHISKTLPVLGYSDTINAIVQ
jgi:hypothetical protein